MVNNQCEDYNECDDFPCPESTPVCTNTIGSFTCEAGSVPPGPNPGGEQEDWEVVDNLEHDYSDLTLIEYSLYNQGVFEVDVNGEILEYKRRRKRQAPLSTTVSVNFLVDQVLPLYGCQCTKLFADNILGAEMGHTDSVDGVCQQKSRCLHCALQKPECENSAYDWIAIYRVSF